MLWRLELDIFLTSGWKWSIKCASYGVEKLYVLLISCGGVWMFVWLRCVWYQDNSFHITLAISCSELRSPYSLDLFGTSVKAVELSIVKNKLNQQHKTSITWKVLTDSYVYLWFVDRITICTKRCYYLEEVLATRVAYKNKIRQKLPNVSFISVNFSHNLTNYEYNSRWFGNIAPSYKINIDRFH
jgi:hypothetical protein